MNRQDFQMVADERIADAEALLLAGRWTGAYYLAGYAVECALKAVIAKRTQAGDFPPKDTAKLYTHSLRELLGFAGLGTANGAITIPGVGLQCTANWDTAKFWKEVVRYENKTEQDARELVLAINEPTEGVLTWLRNHW